ncbi:hypothetical protein D3C73_1004020 [compost metagenome]
MGVQRGAGVVQARALLQHGLLVRPFDGGVESFGHVLRTRPGLRPFNGGQRAAAVGQQYGQLHRCVGLAGMHARTVAALVGFGKYAHGLAAHVTQALHIGKQVGAAHGLGEVDFNNHFAGGIGLFRVVGVAARVHRGRLARLRARGVPAHAGFAAACTGRGRCGAGSSARAQQRILFRRGEMALHLAPDAPVLPPVESQHQQYQQDAQGNQPDLQITHVYIPRHEAAPF